MAEAVIRCFTIGTSRTTRQDAHYAAQQLTEMAVRALSPGTNDPYTARNAIAELTSGLVTIVANPWPPRGRADADGELRLVLDVPSGSDIVDWTFTDLRTHAATDPGVIWGIIVLAGRLVQVAPPELAERIRHHVELLVQAYAEQGVDFDTERLRAWQQTQLG